MMVKKYIIVALSALIVTFNSNSTHYVRRAAAPLGTAAAMCAATYWGDKNVACKEYIVGPAVAEAWRKHMGVDLASSYGWANEYTTPEYRLKTAIRSGDEDAVARQISRGVNVDVFLKYGTTALMDAARKGNINIVRQLLNAGARINLINNYDRTALMEAAINGHRDVVKMLLDAGADVNVINKDGWTALMEASYNGNGDAAGLLLQYGADVEDATDLDEAKYRKCAWYRPWEKDKKGRTHAELLELLLAGKTVCQST